MSAQHQLQLSLRILKLQNYPLSHRVGIYGRLVPFHLLYLAVRFVFLGLFTVFTILFRAVAKGLSFVFNPLLNIVQAFLRALESGYRAV